MFKGLSIQIARVYSQSRTGGEGAYLRDKNTCAETLAENGRRLICERGVFTGHYDTCTYK